MRRWLGALALAAIVAVAVGWWYLCHRPAAPPGLSADQTLRLPLTADVETMDPAQINQPSVGYSLARNVFSGLYKFNDKLELVPDIAAGEPAVTADGLTWTFTLRPRVQFSNGDPVRAADFVFSWSRAASFHNGDAFIFEPVGGFDAVQAGTSTRLVGLSAPDDHTLVARLTQPAGYWLVELAHYAASVVDEGVVRAKGETTWWSTPDGLIGTGPFRMVKREPGKSLDFEPVPNWWSGAAGSLHVHAEVLADRSKQVRAYEQGAYDLVGYAPENTAPSLSETDLVRSRQNPDRYARPWLKTEFIAFNFKRGPFSSLAGDADGRRAFSLAIDRKTLVSRVCLEGATCAPATGGLITKDLAGYLGDGRDTNSQFDPNAAKQALRRWDPDGSLIRGLKLTVAPGSEPLARELVSQWRGNLGVEVGLELPDRAAFRTIQSKGLYAFLLTGFVYDYNSPHDWFELFTPGTFGYSSGAFQTLARKADTELPAAALPDYLAAGRVLVSDAAYIALDYPLGIYLVKPYVQGAGGNAVAEYYWAGITIRKH